MLTLKKRVNQLITTQNVQQDTLVHVISILNITKYAAQVNSQYINIITDTVNETVCDVNNLYNITTLFKQLLAIFFKMFTAKLQFLHIKVAHIHFFPSCHFQTLQYMLSRSKRSYSPKQKISIALFGNVL